VTALRGGGFDRTQWAGIISEILGLSHLLPDCTFQQVSRVANPAARERHEWAVLRHDVPPDARILVQPGFLRPLVFVICIQLINIGCFGSEKKLALKSLLTFWQ
jgi:hypothetical protein